MKNTNKYFPLFGAAQLSFVLALLSLLLLLLYRWWPVLLSAAFIAAGLVFLLICKHRLIADLQRLSSGLQEISDNRWPASLPPPSTVETQTAFNAFRRMADYLHSLLESGQEKLMRTEQALDEEIKIHQNIRQALQKSELLFRQLWEISADGMRLIDAQGTILQVNQAFCDMVQKSEEELLGQPFSIVYEQSFQQKMLQAYLKHYRNNEILPHQELARQLWNGRHIWFAFSNSYLELPGSGRLLLSVIKDITIRKQAEIELQKSEKRFRMLFNHANDAVFVNHISDNQKFDRFIEVNDVACERLLYSREEFAALNPYSIIPQEYYGTLNEITSRLFSDGQAIFEIEHLRKDNRRIPVEISAILFEYKNRPTVLSIARDITQRKQDEIRLRKTRDQLRRLASRLQKIREEERTMIAREMHDELGQMLTVLKIQISLMTAQLQSVQPELEEQISYISKLIDQTVESVQQITSKLRPGILDELGLVAAIEWQAGDFSKHTGISCKCSLLSEELPLNKEKSTALFRILQEALTNVARHAQATRVSIFLRRLNRTLVLEITDNGRGISKEQLSDSHSLGILGMRERALVMGGTLTIHGVPGEGSNVKVELPIEEELA